MPTEVAIAKEVNNTDMKAKNGKKRKAEKPKNAKKDKIDASEEVKNNAPVNHNGGNAKKNKKDKNQKEKEKEVEDVVEPPAKKQKKSSTKPDTLSPEEYRTTHSLVCPPGIPDPIQHFEDLQIPDALKTVFTRLKYTTPTPIQAQTWPVGFEGRDYVGIAETGSGKTVAFMLPAIVRTLKLIASKKAFLKVPSILVLTPTRELAQQIVEVTDQLGRAVGLNSVAIVGGEMKYKQYAKLRQGCEIVIATPGRMNDMIESKKIDVRTVHFAVLDEADRMLDMGFEPQIRSILNMVPKTRQTLLFTATFPNEIRSMAFSYMNQPILIKVGTTDISNNKNIKQVVKVIDYHNMIPELEALVKEIFKQNAKILIFMNSKIKCNNIAQHLWDLGYPVNAIHGDLEQPQRNKALEDFKKGKYPILLATDVAARGLDIKDVAYVINAEFPNSGLSDYTHRIGRTGRAGQQGTAFTFFTRQDIDGLALIAKLEECGEEVPDALRAIANSSGLSTFAKKTMGLSAPRFGGGRGGGRGGKRDWKSFRGGRSGSKGQRRDGYNRHLNKSNM